MVLGIFILRGLERWLFKKVSAKDYKLQKNSETKMAKAIEETPILEGKDAERLLKILFSKKQVKLTKTEREVHLLAKNLPPSLRIK